MTMTYPWYYPPFFYQSMCVLQSLLSLVRNKYKTTSSPTMIIPSCTDTNYGYWSPSNISIFIAYKINLVSSPLLLRYDSSKPFFLKTGWSANGIVNIIMQPNNCSESFRALQVLEDISDCSFELSWRDHVYIQYYSDHVLICRIQ